MIHKDKQDKWFQNDTAKGRPMRIIDEPKTLADYNRLMEMEENKRNGATPHKCPICGGRGFVQVDFMVQTLNQVYIERDVQGVRW